MAFPRIRQSQDGRTPAGSLWRGPVASAALLACLAGSLLVAGCHSGGSSSTGASGPSAVTSDEVAKVNGDTITVGQMYDFMQRLTVQDLAQRVPPTEQIGKVALSQLITFALTSQLAKNEGVPVTQQAVDQRYNDLQLVNESQITLPYDQVLADQGYTAQSYKQDVIAPQVAQFNLLTKGVTATPQEVLASYNSNKDTKYTEPAAVHIERVVVPTKADAQNIYDQASKGTPLANFQPQNEAPAAPGSDTDPTDLPTWINIGQNLPSLAGLLNALKAAKAGQVLKPLQIGPSWWVIKVVAVRPKTAMPYDQVQNLVRWNVLQSKAGPTAAQKLQQDLQTFQQEATMTSPNPLYQSLLQQLKSPPPGAPAMGAPAPTAPAPSAPAPAQPAKPK